VVRERRARIHARAYTFGSKLLPTLAIVHSATMSRPTLYNVGGKMRRRGRGLAIRPHMLRGRNFARVNYSRRECERRSSEIKRRDERVGRVGHM